MVKISKKIMMEMMVTVIPFNVDDHQRDKDEDDDDDVQERGAS